MDRLNATEQKEFRRLLRRNVQLPLLLGLTGAVVFVALIVYLLAVIGWVEHTDRVTRNATEAQRLQAEMQASVRGYLLTGRQEFLEPYERGERVHLAMLSRGGGERLPADPDGATTRGWAAALALPAVVVLASLTARVAA